MNKDGYSSLLEYSPAAFLAVVDGFTFGPLKPKIHSTLLGYSVAFLLPC